MQLYVMALARCRQITDDISITLFSKLAEPMT